MDVIHFRDGEYLETIFVPADAAHRLGEDIEIRVDGYVECAKTDTLRFSRRALVELLEPLVWQ